MKDVLEESRQLPILIDIALLERSMNGVRSARISGRTCRVTYAPSRRAPRIAHLVPSVNDGGVVLTWADGEAPRIRAVYDVREILADTQTEVAVVTNDHDLLAPPVYEAIGCVLRGEAVLPSPHHYDALGIELAESARLLLAALAIPGFV